jgi:hypothetical protein
MTAHRRQPAAEFVRCIADNHRIGCHTRSWSTWRNDNFGGELRAH